MKKSLRIWAVALLAAVAVPLVFLTGSAGTSKLGPGMSNTFLAKQMAIETGKVKPTFLDRKLPSISGGQVVTALEASGYYDKLGSKSGNAPSPLAPALKTQGCSNVFGATTAVPNFRVNQDCSLRRQAEEVIAVNPTDSNNMVAGQNDSRVGFNHCGYDFTTDKGKTWGDQIPPFYQFILLDTHTADACSDPTATFDNAGNAYIGGVLFQAGGSPASALVVSKSNAALKGSFFHTPDSSLSLQTYRANPLGVIESVDGSTVSEDKEFIVADAGASSAKKNNVYMTWTRFADTGVGVGGNSPINFSQSTDGGKTWSAHVEISGSGTFCTDFSGSVDPNACDQNQGSHPFVGPDGTIYVTFTNGNTPDLGHNQQLFVKCPVASNCSSAASWSAPTVVGQVFDKMPYGSVATTGCPGGRQCIPPNGYRVTSFTSGSISADSSGKLYVSWFDGTNIAANCNPNGSAATATPPCDTDVWYSYSTNGGSTWSTPTIVTPATAEGKTAGTGAAQWQPWSQVAPDGSAFYVGYYDREYGTGTSYCETSGCNDITLATITNPATATPTIAYQRITSSSMPNLTASVTGGTNNSQQAGFLGDYMWVTTDSAGHPKLVWADTRGVVGSSATTPEEDLYFAAPGDLPTSRFSVSVIGTGNGGVISDPEGIECTVNTCTGDFPYGSTVRLFPEPESNADFTGWGGDCLSSALALCTKAMTQDYAASAAFEAVPPAKCIVPFVIGKTLKKAKAKITKAGCKPGKVTRAYSRSVKKGHVISTKPEAAKKVALGTKVNIKVSKGKR
jgi:hypothetical protein